MPNLKEYLKTLNVDSSKKEIVELIKALYQSILVFNKLENEHAKDIYYRRHVNFRGLARNYKVKHMPSSSYLLEIKLYNNYYSVTINNGDNTLSQFYHKILKRESAVFKIKNQILNLYQNKELQNHCKIFGGHHYQCILQCLLKFSKS